MTTQPSHVRVLAQTDPVPNLTATYGEVATRTRRHVADLEATLRDLDRTDDRPRFAMPGN